MFGVRKRKGRELSCKDDRKRRGRRHFHDNMTLWCPLIVSGPPYLEGLVLGGLVLWFYYIISSLT
jgi:hypothetical protein